MEEFSADAPVQADAARHVLHIAADLLAQIGHLVDEGDLGGEEGVGGVFDQLGAFAAGEQDRRLVQIERAVDLPHHLPRPVAVAADDDAVGPPEILDRRSLAQEFGVRGHVELRLGIAVADDLLDLAAGADRHGRFGHHHGVAVERRGDLARRRIDIGEVGMAVAAAAGRAHRDEDGVGAGDRGTDIGLEFQPSGPDIGLDHLVEAGLVDRDLAAAQGSDLVGHLVDADHVMAEFRETGARNQADIPRADHCDAHNLPFANR